MVPLAFSSIILIVATKLVFWLTNKRARMNKPDGSEVECQIKNAIKGRLDKKESPLSQVETTSTLDWCDKRPEDRYLKLASIITPYQTIEDSIEWTPLALELLKKSPEPTKVLDEFLSSFSPNGWSGSRAKILESRLPLFDQLIGHSSFSVTTWVSEAKAKWQKFITSEYERENERDIERDERFEW
ncbi:MAG: hypothetical protein ACJAS1_005000 [Oleiphilaceae bacterium]|jgi:hypothetical protein